MNKLSEMTNLEIRENISLINKRQLKNIRKASYLNIFHSILGVKQLLKDENTLDDFKLTKELDLFKKHLEDSINSTILSVNERDERKKEFELEDLKKKREELYEIYLILQGYFIGISYMGEIIDEYGTRLLAKRDYRNIPYDKNRTEELINRIGEKLNGNKKKYDSYIYIISQIILILPMRLAKENYYGIIKDTLIRNFEVHSKSEIEVQINDYKKIFNSSSRDGYGTKFDYYFTEIEKLKKQKLKDKTLKELSDLINKNVGLTKEINKTINITLILGMITNMNIVIFLLNNTEIDLKIKEIYERWIDLLENKDEKGTNKFSPIVKKEIEKIENLIFQDLDKFQELNIEAINRKDFDYNELDDELLFTQKVLTYYNDSEFMDTKVMFPEDEEGPSQEYLLESIDSLVQYINRSGDNMSNLERRIRMRKLLSIIELPFSGIDDFLNYVRYSLNTRIVDKEEINFKINHIHYFLDELKKY